MFVIKNMDTGEYVRRNPGNVTVRTDTYSHTSSINDATIFDTIKLVNWMYDRGKEHGFFAPITHNWQIVEVRKVERPQYEEVKVIG